MKKILEMGKGKKRREREGEEGEVGTIYTSEATAGTLKRRTEGSQTVGAA